MPRWTVLCCLVAALWVAGLGDARRSVTATTTRTVVIDGVLFTPAALTVTVGDTVIWVNKDPFPHTVKSQPGRFDSPPIAPDQSWSYRTTKTGVFPYLCTLHPTMHGTLTVE